MNINILMFVILLVCAVLYTRRQVELHVDYVIMRIWLPLSRLKTN